MSCFWRMPLRCQASGSGLVYNPNACMKVSRVIEQATTFLMSLLTGKDHRDPLYESELRSRMIVAGVLRSQSVSVVSVALGWLLFVDIARFSVGLVECHVSSLRSILA